jgi:hypothetical protein
MQLQLYPYRRCILAHGVGTANRTVIITAIQAGICCHNQSCYEDQTPHLESETVKLP